MANPLSEKFAVLRPSLLPGLLDACVHNRRRERRDVRLFETGSRVHRRRRGPRGGVRRGAARRPARTGRRPTRAVDFFDAKGVVERLPAASGLAVEFAPVERPFLAPGRAAEVHVSAGRRRRAGTLGVRRPAAAGGRRSARLSRRRRDLRRRDRSRRCSAATSAGDDVPGGVAAALPVDRARYLDAGRRSLACCCRSWHDPFGRSRHAGLDRRIRSVSGQGRAGGSKSACRCASRSVRRIAR